MYTQRDIKKLADLVAESIAPEKIILFGSYAYGTPTERSDVDLLVVMSHEELSYEDVVQLGCKVIDAHWKQPRYIKNDLCIIAQSDYREQRRIPISAVYHAVEKGVILYDKSKLESGTV